VIRRRPVLPTWRLLAAIAALSLVVLAFVGVHSGPDSQRAAGAMTVTNRTSASFEQPAGGLSAAELGRHARADLVFDRTHVPLAGRPGAGLGPRFVATSCIACHVRNGRGRAVADEALVRVPEQAGLGVQIQDKAILGSEPEAVVRLQWRRFSDRGFTLRRPDLALIPPGGEPLATTVRRSLRIAPPLLGMGLLEAVPETTITARADPEDADGDGISGRAHWLPGPDGQRRLGRFGWKAISPSVREQSAAAYGEDMGPTTPFSADSDLDAVGLLADISNQDLDLVTFYSQTLGAPRTGQPARSTLVRRGQKLFGQLGCGACHVPTLKTGPAPQAVVGALRDQTIWPYTDLLLHDMGPGLDDGVAELGAASREWRTAPLWGIGLTGKVNPGGTFLHDGRARSLEEAILWHGGEAARSRDRYLALAPGQRRALQRWLQQL
jgi:CxxC motif-containing protein (DUF1111 family)